MIIVKIVIEGRQMIVLEVPAVVFIGISTPGLGRKSTRYSLSQLHTFVSLEFSECNLGMRTP